MRLTTRFFHLADHLEQPIEAMELTRRGYRLKNGLWIGPVHQIVTEGVGTGDLRMDGRVFVGRARGETNA